MQRTLLNLSVHSKSKFRKMVKLSLFAKWDDGRYWYAKVTILGEGQLRREKIVDGKYEVTFAGTGQVRLTGDYLQTHDAPFHVGYLVDYKTYGEDHPTDGTKTRGKISKMLYAEKYS